MKRDTYKKIVSIIGASTGVASAVSVVLNNFWILALTVVTGLTVGYIARQRLEEVIFDERNYEISRKAAGLTLQIVIIGSAAFGYLLIFSEWLGFGNFRELGLQITFIACGIMCTHLCANWYYRRMYGG